METERIRFIDIMRGVAVVVMVMGHSIDSVLSTGVRSTEAFRLYDAVRGFTAPIFLFVAGFAFAIVTERRWVEYRTFSRPTRNRLLKILLLLIIGYALHLPFFSLTKLLHETGPEGYAQLFQVDVLHCVAAGIAMLQGIVFLSSSPHVFNRIAGLTGAGIVLATPFAWSFDFSKSVTSAIAPYLNQMQASIFPIFPYAAFMVFGAVIAHYFLIAQREARESPFVSRMLLLAVVGVACGILFDIIPVSLYPSHDYWKASPNFFLLRLSAVMIVTACFFYMKRLPWMVEHPLLALGNASLLVYAVHLMIVYGSAVNSGLQQTVGKTLPYHEAVGVAVVVLAGMTLLAYAWNYIHVRHTWPSRLIRAGFASTILYLFFTNPW